MTGHERSGEPPCLLLLCNALLVAEAGPKRETKMGVQGVHITLTVSDLSVSGPWYEKLFDADKVFQGPDEVSEVEIYTVPDVLLLGLRQHRGTPAGDTFSYERCGLDHFGMHLSHKDELDKWHTKLNEMGIEHSEIVESPFGHHLSFKDPDGIALEMFVPASQA
jgi:catechol-2,3-dioxygenase